jgi:hypothetical protein
MSIAREAPICCDARTAIANLAYRRDDYGYALFED